MLVLGASTALAAVLIVAVPRDLAPVDSDDPVAVLAGVMIAGLSVLAFPGYAVLTVMVGLVYAVCELAFACFGRSPTDGAWWRRLRSWFAAAFR